jgi:hypothetical protein
MPTLLTKTLLKIEDLLKNHEKCVNDVQNRISRYNINPNWVTQINEIFRKFNRGDDSDLRHYSDNTITIRHYIWSNAYDDILRAIEFLEERELKIIYDAFTLTDETIQQEDDINIS